MHTCMSNSSVFFPIRPLAPSMCFDILSSGVVQQWCSETGNILEGGEHLAVAERERGGEGAVCGG